MDYLLRQYNDRLQIVLRKYSFRKFRRTYLRMVNDVVQSLSLNRGRATCTIEFSVLPLALPVDDPAYFYGGRYYLGALVGKHPWFFLHNSSIDIDPIMSEIIELIEQHLLPFFERANNCRNAYDEIINLEKGTSIGLNGEVVMNDRIKVCMSIKNGEFSLAYMHMLAIYNQNKNAIEANSAQFEQLRGIKARDDYKAKVLPNLLVIKTELERLRFPDIEYYSNQIVENEAKSMSFLATCGVRTLY